MLADIKRKCFDGEYENYVSLGSNCQVAILLKKVDLRNCSLPYDWCFSRWECIEKGFSGDFDFLHYRKLYQKKIAPHTYKNPEYGIAMPHDFNAYVPLAFQLHGVHKKYKRRTDRFLKVIKSPTLFIRYCYNEKELEYIEENFDTVVSLIRKSNPANDIIFLSHFEEEYLIPTLFYIKKDSPEDDVAKHPLDTNEELFDMLDNAKLLSKDANREFTQNKQPRKRGLLERIFRHLFKNRIYKHIRQY